MSERYRNAGPAGLAPAVRRFVLHWGDMGSRWGVSRSVAQIHALLFVSERPLAAEEIAETLGIARSNVSTSLKELAGWRLVRKVPVAGDRRDHFEAEGDVFEMAMRIVAERKAREFDPAVDILRTFLEEARGNRNVPLRTWKRLSEMHDVVESVNGWYRQVARLPRDRLEPVLRLGTRALDLLAPLLRKP